MTWVQSVLERLRSEGIYRELSSEGEGTDFSSNDYLGLARGESIRAGLIRALAEGCPLGATGSRLLCGNTSVHERVEAFLAETFRVSSALLFSSGFLANLGVLTAMGGEDTEFFSDANNHASLIDGIRLARSRCQIFPHNDVGILEEILAASRRRNKVIVTESVFSMDGDLAPLGELFSLARRFDAWLFVDEAHATGVFGERGLGRLEDFNTGGVRLISTHTGGKALGGQGAFVLSGGDFRDLLINRARAFIFSTALAPLNALQIELALREVMRQAGLGARALTAARAFCALAGLPCSAGQSQIVPLVLGSNERAIGVAHALRERGLEVRAIRSPTVLPGTERLRLSFKSYHSEVDVTRLDAALREVLAC